MPIVYDIAGLLGSVYPFSRAEKWDKVGLLIGDGRAKSDVVLVAHEITDATIDEAMKVSANCVVVYHPPLFRPLENLDFANHSARLAARCIAGKIAVVAVHTALDNAPLGFALGDKLAAKLGLTDVRVLDPSGQDGLYKLVVYVPTNDVGNFRDALWDAGAGSIGQRDQASLRSRRQEAFHPRQGANPTIGFTGELETVDECRLEVIVPESRREEVVNAMKQAHPYEEVAHDIYKFRNEGGEGYGAARVGTLTSYPRFDDFAREVGNQLKAPNLRVVRSGKEKVKTVACVPGSGASTIDAAVKGGADVLISGDFKHHDALQAQAHGLALIDVTHVATERAAIDMICDALHNSSTRLGFEVVRSQLDTNPFAELT